MKYVRLTALFSSFLFSVPIAQAYDVFPGMIKPTAASPNGRYLVTKAPFAPHVVWQMPEGKPLLVAGIISYGIGESPQSSGNRPLPPVITNDGWLITSSDSGQDDFGPTLVQATNIHNGAVQTLTDNRSCQVFDIEGGVSLSCFSRLESWANNGSSWQKIAQTELPDYALVMEDTASNQQTFFGVEYSEGEFDEATTKLLEQNFGIRAFNAHRLTPEFIVPLKCCLSPSFVVASGEDDFLWAERVETAGSQNNRQAVTLHRLNGDEVEKIDQLTLAAYPHGLDDESYHPRLSADGRYLSGVFVSDNGQTQYIYNLQRKKFLTNTPYRRGLWLADNLYASSSGEPNTEQPMVTVHTFPVPEDSSPRYHTLFEDLESLIAEGQVLNGESYQQVDYRPSELSNGVIARDPQDLITLIESGEFSPLTGKVIAQYPVNAHAVWFDIEQEDHARGRYLAYRVGSGGAARWVIVARLT